MSSPPLLSFSLSTPPLPSFLSSIFPSHGNYLTLVQIDFDNSDFTIILKVYLYLSFNITTYMTQENASSYYFPPEN